MTTLRERVREALASRDPDERTARSDLDHVLGRARRPRRPTRWAYLAIPALGAAALLVYALARPAVPVPTTDGAQARGIHLYLHVTGEPAERALALELQEKGPLK